MVGVVCWIVARMVFCGWTVGLGRSTAASLVRKAREQTFSSWKDAGGGATARVSEEEHEKHWFRIWCGICGCLLHVVRLLPESILEGCR